jgi:hypothetical protein
MGAPCEVSIELGLWFYVADSNNGTTDQGGGARVSSLKNAGCFAGTRAEHFSYIFKDGGV